MRNRANSTNKDRALARIERELLDLLSRSNFYYGTDLPVQMPVEWIRFLDKFDSYWSVKPERHQP